MSTPACTCASHARERELLAEIDRTRGALQAVSETKAGYLERMLEHGKAIDALRGEIHGLRLTLDGERRISAALAKERDELAAKVALLSSALLAHGTCFGCGDPSGRQLEPRCENCPGPDGEDERALLPDTHAQIERLPARARALLAVVDTLRSGNLDLDCAEVAPGQPGDVGQLRPVVPNVGEHPLRPRE